MGVVPADRLLSINGNEILDIFDYHYHTNDEYLEVVIRKADGQEWELEIEKEPEEDLGIEFERGLMDEYRSCHNKCIFCFIDQMPKGMRDTLYFKDDDSRLSFLQGNYVTLTNMKEEDLQRVIDYRLGPIHISIHTTNPRLRCEMLNNRFAKDILEKIELLYQANIPMQGQIVLCKGINDGEELEAAIKDLTRYAPLMESVSIVPVGLTKFREGLYPLLPFEKEDAKGVLKVVEKWQTYCYDAFGIHFIHASDEWYLLAGKELPEQVLYDGYPQLENGVGMLRLLWEEFMGALSSARGDANMQHVVSMATGYLAAPFLKRLMQKFSEKYPKVTVQVFPIRNDFFGTDITVSGLLTGQDIIKQLKGEELGQKLLLPCNLLRSGEEVFLDDIPLKELKKALQVPVDIVKSDGQHLLSCLIGQ
ncbi:DUF512 domain-containing protein [Lachnospiraceae bacterium ZAX-1]